MNYNDIVSTLREIARDGLRLRKVNSLRADRLVVANELSSVERNHEEFVRRSAKEVAILNFRLSQLVDADPEKAEKTERLTKELESCPEELENEAKRFAKEVEALNKQLAEIDERIAKVQSGEWKVDMDVLNREAQDLIEEVTRAAAGKVSLDTAESAS